jgi:hypothetical protein
MASRRKAVLIGTVAVLAAGGFFLLGRLMTADGAGSSHSATNDYFNGLQVGEAQGREEGRALQVGSEVAADSKTPVGDAFTAGYAAGSNDAFGGFDGGWALASPYLVIVEPGNDKVTYRFSVRTLVEPDTNYYLCADGRTICHEPRRH